MQAAAQEVHAQPPVPTTQARNDSVNGSQAVEALQQRLEQPQAQQPLPPMQLTSTVSHSAAVASPPASSGNAPQLPAEGAVPQLPLIPKQSVQQAAASSQSVPQAPAAKLAVPHAAAAPGQGVKQEPANSQTTGAVAAAAAQQGRVLVAAGALHGFLDLNTWAVTYEGRTMKPTEFEVVAGITSHKSWKQVLRVMMPDGRLGPTVERWLAEQNPAPPPQPAAQPAAQPGARPKRQKEAKVQHVARPATTQQRRPPPPPQPDQPQKATSADILSHLSRQYIGLLPPDPTAAPLPAELPRREGVKVMDLNTMSEEDIMAAARATATQDPFAAKLPDPPGVRRSRQAFITGQAPVAKRPRLQAEVAADAAEASFRLGEFLEGKRAELPWEAMGLTRAPIMAGEELDVRALYTVVQAHGGYDAVTKGRMWARIASGLAIPLDYQNAGTVLRGHYQRLLLRHERQVSAARSYSTRQATGSAGLRSDTPLQRPSSRSASPVSQTAADAMDTGDRQLSPTPDGTVQRADVQGANSGEAAGALQGSTAASAAADSTRSAASEVAAVGAMQSAPVAAVPAAQHSPAGAMVTDQGAQAMKTGASGRQEAPPDIKATAMQDMGGAATVSRGTSCNLAEPQSGPVPSTVLPPPSDWGQVAGQGSGIPGL